MRLMEKDLDIKNKGDDCLMIIKKNEKSLHQKLKNLFSGCFSAKFQFTEEEKSDRN